MRIADELLASRLAACVQVLPIRSIYTWKGKTVREGETLMLIKAKASDFESIKETILKLHDYEVPEVISLAIDQGSEVYLRWITEVTHTDSRNLNSPK
jgi:periplasmic divalent cation tolerance protein